MVTPSDALLIAIVVSIPPTLVGIAALVQASKTYKLVNSHMDALLAAVRINATYIERAAGKLRAKELIEGGPDAAKE